MSVIFGEMVSMDTVVRMRWRCQGRKRQCNIRVQMLEIFWKERWQGRTDTVIASTKPIGENPFERCGVDEGVHRSCCGERGNIIRRDRVHQEIMVGIVENGTSWQEK